MSQHDDYVPHFTPTFLKLIISFESQVNFPSMIILQVSANKESYELTHKHENINILLYGNLKYNSNDVINFEYDGLKHRFKSTSELFNFCEEIRGAEFDSLFISFLKYGFENKLLNQLSKKKYPELSLLKSFFLIYTWIENSLLQPDDINIDSKLNNEFIIDSTNFPGPQKDVYFISKHYSNTENEKYINKLILFNLLAKLIITINGLKKTYYFIPLLKPGLSRENFISDVDSTGKNTYLLWKKILDDRNKKINNWINLRF